MYKLRAEHSFDSAHFLNNYKGKCANIHGHRWRVVFEVAEEKLKVGGQLDGMIDDFGTIKKYIKELIDFHDHALIIEKDSLKERTLNALLDENFRIIELPFRPTAENFSKYFFDKLSEKGYYCSKVYVYETPTNCAIYEGN